MCIETSNNNNNLKMEINKTKYNNQDVKKMSYSITKVLQKVFKKHYLKIKETQQIQDDNLKNSLKADSSDSLESLENIRNAGIEQENMSVESYENEANERKSLSQQSVSYEIEDYDFIDLSTVPVHFARTEHGTFFWTAASHIAADNDLIEPLYCTTNNQIAIHQMQDRWAQA